MTIIDSWTLTHTTDDAVVTQKIKIDQASGYRSVWVTSDYGGKDTRYYVGRAISDDSLNTVLRVTGLAKP